MADIEIVIEEETNVVIEVAPINTAVIYQGNIDGGGPSSIYLPTQVIDGGTP